MRLVPGTNGIFVISEWQDSDVRGIEHAGFRWHNGQATHLSNPPDYCPGCSRGVPMSKWWTEDAEVARKFIEEGEYDAISSVKDAFDKIPVDWQKEATVYQQEVNRLRKDLARAKDENRTMATLMDQLVGKAKEVETQNKQIKAENHNLHNQLINANRANENLKYRDVDQEVRYEVERRTGEIKRQHEADKEYLTRQIEISKAESERLKLQILKLEGKVSEPEKDDGKTRFSYLEVDD